MSARLLDPGALDQPLLDQWDALAHRASEPNAFGERWCLLPAIAHFSAPGTVRLMAVFDAHGDLTGLMPVARAHRYGRLPLRHVGNWLHPNAFHGAPLIAAGQEAAVWTAMLDLLDAQPWARTLLHISGLTEDGPVHRGLICAAARRRRRCDTVHSETRALLQSDLSPADYWTAAVRGKKRKELRRQANRLSEEGQVAFTAWQVSTPTQPWADAFLTLEHQGWKGANGSSLATSDATRAWLHAIIAGAAEQGRLHIRAMTLNDRPIAMLISFLCGQGGFSFKTAFDETLARYSPGVLLQQANLDLLDRAGLNWVDSCAAQDHPMIDSLWRERRTIVRVSVPLGRTGDRLRFGAVRTAERLWTHLRQRRQRPAAPVATLENDG